MPVVKTKNRCNNNKIMIYSFLTFSAGNPLPKGGDESQRHHMFFVYAFPAGLGRPVALVERVSSVKQEAPRKSKG